MARFYNELAETVAKYDEERERLQQPPVKLESFEQETLKRSEEEISRVLESNFLKMNQIFRKLESQGVRLEEVKRNFIKSIEEMLRRG